MENELIVKIEKLSSDGTGIARHNGIVIFIDKTCPQDKCKIRILKKTKNYYIGELIEIIEKSPHRTKPFCPMQNVCGACQLQFIDYDYQLEQKREIVKDAMRGINIEIEAVTPSPQTKEFRHKIQYPIRQTQVSKRILAGYFKPKSHDIINIKYCPIQPSICDEIIEYIREQAPMHKIEGYNEEKHQGLLRHVVIRSSAETKNNLVALVINANKTPERIKDFAQKLYDKFEQITGVTVNLNPNKTNLILTDKTELLYGKDYVKEKICNIVFKIGTNTFFQVNPKSAENIFKFVKEYLKNNFNQPKVLDAYAGISAFGLVISDICSEVESVEECKASVDLAKEVKKLNNITNIKLYNMDSARFFEEKLKTAPKSFDAIILDPPRKGCTEESLKYAISLTKSKIIYVSCNPATLARDLKYLIDKGGKVEIIKPFDMFCHTFHVENVAIIDITDCK